MARFRFRLQPVLDVRERAVDERRREFAERQRDLAAAEATLARSVADREAQRAALTRDHRAFDVDALRAAYAHLTYLDRRIEAETARAAECREYVERAQSRLVAANTDRKVLETLRTRRFEAFTVEAALSEQREADDHNARRYGRAHQEGGDARE